MAGDLCGPGLHMHFPTPLSLQLYCWGWQHQQGHMDAVPREDTAAPREAEQLVLQLSTWASSHLEIRKRMLSLRLTHLRLLLMKEPRAQAVPQPTALSTLRLTHMISSVCAVSRKRASEPLPSQPRAKDWARRSRVVSSPSFQSSSCSNLQGGLLQQGHLQTARGHHHQLQTLQDSTGAGGSWRR